MPMIAPLFLDDKDFSSTVTLVNDAIAQMKARVVVLDSEGIEVASKEVEMPGHTSLPIQIHDLLNDAGSAANLGSVLVIPQPAPGMPIGAQLSIVSRAGATSAYIEEEMLPQNEGRQGIYRAAAVNVKGSPIVALKSLGQSVQTVTIECFSEKTAPTNGVVQLRPGELLLVAACDSSQTGRAAVNNQMFHDVVDRGSVGVAVSTNGTPGDLIASGFSVYSDERGPYFSSLNFTNPTEQLSSGMIFTGIPTGTAEFFPNTVFQSEVAVSNFSSKPAEVSVTLAHTIAGKTSTELVQKLVLAGQSSRTVRIPAHGDPAMTNSLVVRSSLSPGDVVSQFIAWGDFGVRTLELQPKDNDSVQNGGGHPWSIEQGTNSTLLLFNHTTDGPKKFEVLIGNGKQLWVGSYELAPMETKALKINEIVKKQIPDAKGTVLSKDILTGQVGWWTHHKTWGKGRLMVSQPQAGMARSFSCGTCATLCEDAFLYPDDQASFPIGGEDDLGYATLQECLAACTECGGTPQGPGTGFITWSSGNPSIAKLSSGQHATMAHFTGMAPGQARGNFSATDDGCTAQGGGPITVTPSISPARGLIGTTVMHVIISGSGFGSSPTVNAGTGINVTYNSRSDTSIDTDFAIASTASGGNQSVTVTTTSGTQLPSVNFYVQIPKTLIRDSAYGTGGLGSLTIITNGSVVDIYGNTLLTGECGEYRNIGYLLVDQETPAQTIQGDYTLVEQFSNYSTTVPGLTQPPNKNNPIVYAQTLLGDTQFFGTRAPSCPGSNDHESFNQGFTVQIDSSHSYGLSMVNNIARGEYSGTATVNVTITTP